MNGDEELICAFCQMVLADGVNEKKLRYAVVTDPFCICDNCVSGLNQKMEDDRYNIIVDQQVVAQNTQVYPPLRLVR
ncbi:hypothetical protein D3C76_1360780 [compost metagenome]